MASSIQSDRMGSGAMRCLAHLNGCNGSRLRQPETTESTSSSPLPLPPSTAFNHSQEKAQNREEMNSSIEDILASGMNKLSVQERAEAFDDVHCVGEELKESPEIIQQTLEEFERAVQAECNPTYEMAVDQNRAYVEDPTFRLKFLRANFYDVDRSVRQMINFLQHKAKYFGTDKIARDITLQDLNEEEVEVLFSKSPYHIQEGRDRTGRVVVQMFNTAIVGKGKVETLIRVTYFIWFNVLISIPEVQLRGVVCIYYDIAKPGEIHAMPGIPFTSTLLDFALSLPVRYSATHTCLQPTKANLVLNQAYLKISLGCMSLYTKVRSRIHIGSTMELQYQLRSHGIPMDTFPIDMNGNVRKVILNDWLLNYLSQQSTDANPLPLKFDIGPPPTQRPQHQSSKKARQEPTKIPTSPPFSHKADGLPCKNDVLLGRGRFTQTWPGNVQFREFLQQHSSDYDKVPRRGKLGASITLTNELVEHGVRFFRHNNESGKWVEADLAEVRKTVSQVFRSMKKKKEKVLEQM